MVVGPGQCSWPPSAPAYCPLRALLPNPALMGRVGSKTLHPSARSGDDNGSTAGSPQPCIVIPLVDRQETVPGNRVSPKDGIDNFILT